jgi:pimeloyl-ACP methyl ester carboxylesterase
MGESDKPIGRYDFGLLADDLGFILETLDARDVTLVGWSMGCSISLEYLRSGGGRTSRLALVNGPIKLTRTADFPWTMTRDEVDGYLDDMARHWPGTEREFVSRSLGRDDSPLAPLYHQIALQTPVETAIRIVREQMTLDHTDVVRTLKIPVLAIYGKHDPFYPTELAEWIAAAAPDGRCVVFEHSAHAVHYDEPEKFTELITAFAQRRL